MRHCFGLLIALATCSISFGQPPRFGAPQYGGINFCELVFDSGSLDASATFTETVPFTEFDAYVFHSLITGNGTWGLESLNTVEPGDSITFVLDTEMNDPAAGEYELRAMLSNCAWLLYEPGGPDGEGNVWAVVDVDDDTAVVP